MKINRIEKLIKQRHTDFNYDSIKNELKILKKLAVEKQNQEKAKYIWCLEQILEIKTLFIKTFDLMKNNDFENAWYNLDRCDIELSFLRPHFEYANNEYDLVFIENEIIKYQQLFPYEYFFSRETIESDFTCSICGYSMGIRNKCGHKVGEIYDGEMCCRIVNKIKLLGISIVKKPFDKYSIIHIKDTEYNYYLLESLMEYLNSPFEEWGYEIELRQWDYKKIDMYKNVGRNDMCPCGSDIKFKKCCLKKNNPIKHYKLWGTNDNFLKHPKDYNTFNTKK